MKIRRIISLTAFLSFLLTLLTSVILYITPHGRVAYWADWKLWGLDKDQWGAVHINLGTLFILALLWHIYNNWLPIKNYLKNKARQLRIFTPEFVVALIVTLVVTLGTLFLVPPFSSFLDLGENIKEDLAKKYGEPPYGHAELSPIRSFARTVGLDLDESLQRLEEAGIKVESEDITIKELAVANGVSPQHIYLTMLPEEDPNAEPKPLPETSPVGTGKKTLSDFCQEYGLDAAEVAGILKEQGFEATPDMTMKAIAESKGTNPSSLFDVIREAVVE